tara:strand:+ start:248 stop:790 length:543 start_codon:yes stop_codon:yes gene_type:complete
MWALVESNSISKIYTKPTSLLLNGLRHPSNIFSLWTEAELKAIGIYEITIDRSNFKDTTYYSNTTITYTYNSSSDTVTGAYGTATAKDLATLKIQKKNLINEEAFSTLKDSDWLAIRAAEGGTAVPSSWATWRAGVRTKANDMQTLIDNAADVDALAALYVYNSDDPPTRPLGVFPNKPS